MNFIENALGYKHQWWRYLLNLLLCFIFSNVLVFIGTIVCMACGMPMGEIMAISSSTNGIYALVIFTITLLSFLLSFKCIHRGKFSLLIKGEKPFNWKNFAMLFGVIVVILGIISTIEMLVMGNYSYSFQLKQDLPLLLLLLPLVALQTLFEEIVFRAYIPQGLSLFIKNKWVCVVIAAFLFMLLHCVNQPVIEGGALFFIPYFVIGLSLGFIAFYDNGIEKAWAVHFANNVIAMFFIIDEKPELSNMPSLFKYNGIDPQNGWDIIYVSVFYMAVAFCLYKVYKWNSTPKQSCTSQQDC